jgi:DNA-3-methyladenine glycosylase
VKLLQRAFYDRDSTVVAPELLNKMLVSGQCSGRICEVEAYTQDDPASHSFRGRTPRNQTMFASAGHLYVYFVYGMHFCANVVTGAIGDGQAVLIRAVDPMAGIDIMEARRGRRSPLCDGPAKLCQAFGFGRSDDGLDLCAGGTIGIFDDGTPPPESPTVTPRIGISVAVDLPRRWLIG